MDGWSFSHRPFEKCRFTDIPAPAPNTNGFVFSKTSRSTHAANSPTLRPTNNLDHAMPGLHAPSHPSRKEPSPNARAANEREEPYNGA